jgi:spore germination cell wall hydrolase CwlJ-like protein
MRPQDIHDAIAVATIWKESRGEDYRGKLAVAYVLTHRMERSRWPSTPGAVCLQPYQFSCWNTKDDNRTAFPVLDDQTMLDCFYAWKMAGLRNGMDPSKGADHYHSIELEDTEIARQWKMTVDELLQARTATIGRHHFYRLEGHSDTT